MVLYNPLLDGFSGRHSCGVLIAVLAFWNALEGISASITLRQLNIFEQLCQHLYFRARTIMAFGAHRMQKAFVWGIGGSDTTEVELDISLICRWSIVEDGRVVYYFYCYIGARQRGSTRNFAIVPLDISRSQDTGRVNPETSEEYHGFCRAVFGDARRPNILSMTDGNPSYRCRREECQFWFVQQSWVDHSANLFAEFSMCCDSTDIEEQNS